MRPSKQAGCPFTRGRLHNYSIYEPIMSMAIAIDGWRFVDSVNVLLTVKIA